MAWRFRNADMYPRAESSSTTIALDVAPLPYSIAIQRCHGKLVRLGQGELLNGASFRVPKCQIAKA